MKTKNNRTKMRTKRKMKGGNKEMVLAAVKINGMDLQKFKEYQIDREIVLAAVTQNGEAIKYVDKAIIDKEIALAAIKHGDVLGLLPSEIIDDEIALLSVTQDGMNLQSVPPNITTQEIANKAFENNPLSIEIILDMYPDFINSDMILYIVKQDYMFFFSIVSERPNLINKDIVLAAVEQNSTMLEYVPNDLKTEEIILIAVNQNGMVLKFVPDKLKTKAVVVAALTNTIHASQFVSAELIQSYNLEEIFHQLAHPRLMKELKTRISTQTPKEIMLSDSFDKYMIPAKPLQIDKEDTVTLYIYMHGGIRIRLIPKMPTNTIIGSSVGLCQFSGPNVLQKLNHLKELYSTHVISEANKIHNDTYADNVNPPGGFEQYQKELDTYYPKQSWEETKELFVIQSKQTNFIRSYTTDRDYSITNDADAHSMGIYIVSSNNPRLLEAIGSTYKETFKHMPPPDNKLQCQNLNNVEVATTILTKMIGPDGSIGMVGPYGVGKPNNLYTNIPHYDRLTLSAILIFFGRMGIKHVNIIENSCRIILGHPVPNHIARQISEIEKEQGAEKTDELKSKGSGGTRLTKYKTRKLSNYK